MQTVEYTVYMELRNSKSLRAEGIHVIYYHYAFNVGGTENLNKIYFF